MTWMSLNLTPKLDLSLEAPDIPQCSRRVDKTAYAIMKTTKGRLNQIHLTTPLYLT
jgi:hypothetical protein